MLTALMICGDYWHAAAPYEPALKRALAGVEHHLTTRAHPRTFDRAALDDIDLLVLCKESVLPGTHGTPGQANWMKPKDEAAVLNWVESGGMLFVWHSGAAGYTDKGLKKLFGGEFRGHPPIHPFSVEVTRPEHPLAKGLEGFEATDELYTFTVEDSAHFPVFLRGVSTEHDSTQPIAWTHEHGKGVVVTWLLGHLGPTVNHAVSRKLLENIVALAARRAG